MSLLGYPWLVLTMAAPPTLHPWRVASGSPAPQMDSSLPPPVAGTSVTVSVERPTPWSAPLAWCSTPASTFVTGPQTPQAVVQVRNSCANTTTICSQKPPQSPSAPCLSLDSSFLVEMKLDFSRLPAHRTVQQDVPPPQPVPLGPLGSQPMTAGSRPPAKDQHILMTLCGACLIVEV